MMCVCSSNDIMVAYGAALASMGTVFYRAPH